MSRCLLYAFGVMSFISCELYSRSMAQEIAVTSLPIASPPVNSTEFFESHRLELGQLPAQNALMFGDIEPLFFAGLSETNLNGTDWDFLWRNAARIPITSIPEPGSGSLLIGGAILLCLRRMRKTSV